jgi:choice-of-anchor B domain-containing protein
VTDKVKPTIISKTSYEGATYTHQGWVLDKNNQEWLLLDDEYDEVDGEGLAADGRPVTYIWNIKSLAKPVQTGYYKSPVVSVDHNQYIHEGKSFQSNYGSGFRILNISSIPQDPTGKGVHELGFFDIYPEDDFEEGGGATRFVGTWSSYAMFKSGYIFVNTMERGGYVLKYSPRADAVAPPGMQLGPKPAGAKPASQLPGLGQIGGAKGSGLPWSWTPTGGNSEDDDDE